MVRLLNNNDNKHNNDNTKIWIHIETTEMKLNGIFKIMDIQNFYT